MLETKKKHFKERGVIHLLQLKDEKEVRVVLIGL